MLKQNKIKEHLFRDYFTTIVIEILANGETLKEIFRSQVESSLNMLMQSERTAFLGYEP